MTQHTVNALIEHAWNYVLSRVSDADPPAYRVLFWLHLASVEELDAEQVCAFLAALVEAGAI